MTPHRAVIAALPREIAGLVGRTRPDATLVRHGIYLYRVEGALVAAAGMGRARVTAAVQACLELDDKAALVSVGLAGSCTPALPAGSVVEPGTVVDTGTGERFGVEGAPGTAPTLVSADAIASVAEKSRLATSYGAALVDMEAATVARLAAAHGLHFRAIKAISDAHDFELASLARFAGPRGEFRTAAFALHTSVRPHHWRPAATLGRHSRQALAAMTTRVRELLHEKS